MMFSRVRHGLLLLALLVPASGARAGLYYSGEAVAELPSQWRGFLLDQRTLRNIPIKPAPSAQPNPARLKYQEEAVQLEKKGRPNLTADELADLGALYVRLGEVDRAVEVLRDAQRAHPNHFHTLANLGTAWQMQGDLGQAADCLEQAVRLAPGKLEKAEKYQLRLVRLRQHEDAAHRNQLDDLFGVSYSGADGRYEAGKIAEEQRRQLPSDAAAILQQLGLWLPADGRLLWQLAELANAHGDVRTAAAILDGCVTEFGMRAPELRQHRQVVRAAADELSPRLTPGGEGAVAAHENHVGGVRPRSQRPLLHKLDESTLPPINATGTNALPWAVLAQTVVDRKFRPTFANFLKELDGKQVELTGFMQPLGEDLEFSSFLLIEYPVGCWYCEMPEITGIVLVELPPGKTKTLTRGPVKVVGTLSLNGSDPENFLYTLARAKVMEAD